MSELDVLGLCDTDQSSSAAIRVQLASGLTLEFCAHHWLPIELKMIAAGATVVKDQREALYAKA